MKLDCLFIDIGNTAIDFFLCHEERNYTFKVKASDSFQIKQTIQEIASFGSINQCLISSVNSRTLKEVSRHLDNFFVPHKVLTGELMNQFALSHGYTVTNTSYLGSDLFCDIISREAKEGLIIIDLGTAGKVIFLDKDKVFHGCSIFPGIQQFPKVLCQSTDLLEEFPLMENPPVVSLKTEECISSGAIYGTVGIVESLVQKIIQDYHCPKATIILTGGNGHYLKDLLLARNSFTFETDANIVIEGLAKYSGFDDISRWKKTF